MRPFAATDQGALEDALGQRLERLPRHARPHLAARWHETTAPLTGLVLPGLRPIDTGFAFYRLYEQTKVRLAGLLGSPVALPRLLDAVLPQLQARAPAVLVEAESWWRVFGYDDDLLDDAWRRHGFDQLPIEVLERSLPARSGAPTVGGGYHLAPWRTDDLRPAATLMARTPDPLQRRIQTTVEECVELLARTDLERGALAWRGDQLVGLISVSAAGDVGQLYVAEAHQGRGLGGALLDSALARLVGPRVRLTMVAGNDRAWGLYRSRGFRRLFSYPCRVWTR